MIAQQPRSATLAASGPASGALTGVPVGASVRDKSWLDRRATFSICAALLVLFGLLSYTATLRKCATYDEIVHLVGGYMHRYFHDYRINPEDPALFGMWATLPHGDSELAVDVRAKTFQISAVDHNYEWPFAYSALYRTPENDPDALLRVSRSMFTYLGVALGVMCAWWSWKLAGSVGAIVATVLFAFDPNLAAHASLVKNDVPLALLMLGLGYAIWQFGRLGGLWRMLLVALICAIAVNVKFSGVLFGPITILLLICRAVFGGDWIIAHVDLRTVTQRLAAVAGILLVIVFLSWGTTWAVYGFRYNSLREGQMLDNNFLVMLTRQKEIMAATNHNPTEAEYAAHPGVGTIPRLAFTVNKYHLLPHAWTYGFIFTYATTLIRSTYLLGQSDSITGWWYYFPLAVLFKTPLATLTAMIVALVLAVSRFVFLKLGPPETKSREDRLADLWTLLCLLVPPAIYSFVAITGHLNLGIRHMLPVYPFIFVGIALVGARLMRTHRQWTIIAGAVLAIGLMAESLAAYPNYIPFFNTAAGGSRGGIRLLADSNLDWGQDLRLLADWYKTHNDRPLYLCYFGMADPNYYGVSYVNLRGGSPFFPTASLLDQHQPGYVAISATNLQGVYFDMTKVPEYAALRKQKPLIVFGGSIYLYAWPGASVDTAGK